MSIELVVLVWVTFKRHNGLYFWSIIVTTVGIALQTTGYILKEFQNDCPPILTTIICKLGWVSNVSGFSIVLWSRLHLVVRNPKVLKLVLAMIIVDGILLHTPIVVFEFGLISRHHWTYVRPMEIMERIQQTIFSIQETIISGLYIYHTARFLNSGYPSHTRKVIALLVSIQILVILLDATLCIFDYHNQFTLKCTIHPFVYSVKLKLEFIVLNQLLTLVKRGITRANMTALIPDSDSTLGTSPQEQANTPAKKVTAGKHRFHLPHSFHTSATTAQARTALQPAVPQSPSTSLPDKESGKKMDDIAIESPPPERVSSDQTLQADETDLIKIVGDADEDPSGGEKTIDDIERQYLGRFGM
jgi:hypothetical protein